MESARMREAAASGRAFTFPGPELRQRTARIIYQDSCVMTGFTGFPSGKNPYVPVPDAFFTVLLPEIEDTAELKVTLHLFWLLAQKKGNPRCVSDRDLL